MEKVTFSEKSFDISQFVKFLNHSFVVCPANWKPGEKGLKTDLIAPTRFTGEEPPFVHQRRKSEKLTMLQKPLI
jgi:hypothetical protein